MKTDYSMIPTLNALRDLVDRDAGDYELKRMAELFLNAANDWPTYNQTSIAEFVQEMKDYFGDPLTKEKISEKPLDFSNHNAWRHEAACSIREMFQLAEIRFGHADFEKLMHAIFSHYASLAEKK